MAFNVRMQPSSATECWPENSSPYDAKVLLIRLGHAARLTDELAANILSGLRWRWPVPMLADAAGFAFDLLMSR